jgi:hypothetical protein
MFLNDVKGQRGQALEVLWFAEHVVEAQHQVASSQRVQAGLGGGGDARQMPNLIRHCIISMGLLSDVTSVADPGCFIPDPDPTIAPSRIRGVKKHRIPDPTYICIKAINKFCLLIPDPGSDHCSIRIPDPGGKKAPDPGSATLDVTMNKIVSAGFNYI